MLLSRMGVRLHAKMGPCATVVRSAISHMHPMLVTTMAAVLNVIPLLFSMMFTNVTTTVIFKLAFTALLALFVAPTLCTMFCGMGGRL